MFFQLLKYVYVVKFDFKISNASNNQKSRAALNINFGQIESI